MVSFVFAGFASAGAVAVCADAIERLPATRGMTAQQAPMRNMVVPPLRILSCRTEQAVQESKAVGRASCASHQLSFLATRVLHAKRYTSLENALGIADQKILTALSKVFQTPQASGMPTNSQNNAAFASSPPLPMPNDPCWIAASLLALAACSLATSASLMCHLGSTGLIR